jgi:hypothetical protein
MREREIEVAADDDSHGIVTSVGVSVHDTGLHLE